MYRIEADRDGPARARALVDREFATRVSRPRLEEVELMVSELVSDRIRFGSSDKLQPITLDLRVEDRVWCGVSSAGPPLRASEALRAPHRWGLKMVAGLADRWGVRRVGEGTQVWFETSLCMPRTLLRGRRAPSRRA